MFRKFDEDSQTLLEIKIRILHQIKCLEDPKYKINYILDDNPKKYLSSSFTFYEDYLNLIKEYQVIVINIIKNASQDEINSLSSFFIDNFYENTLSSNFIENELLYLIWKLLNIEFNNIQKEDDYEIFLNNSNISILLSSLKKKSDVQEFLNLTFKNIMEYIDNVNHDWDLDIENLVKKEIPNIKSSNNNYQKYNYQCLIDFNYEELKKKIEETENQDMKDYLNNIIKNIEKDDSIYTNLNFLNTLYKNKHSDKILIYYSNINSEILKLIEMMLKSLNNNINLLPYSIKCVCKMIDKLVKKKFPNCNTILPKMYIKKFLFDGILNEVFNNPKEGCLIENVIITNNILEKLKIVEPVLSQLLSFQLYESKIKTSYVFFNKFFIDLIPQVFNVFNKSIEIEFTDFINEVINSNEYFNYEYFKDNPNENLYYISYFITPQNLYLLGNITQTINKKNVISFDNEKIEKKFKSLINKLKVYNEELLDKIKKDEEENIQRFLLFKNLKLSSLMQEINNIKKKIIFSIPLPKNDNDILNSNLIKIENFLCSLLYHYKTLNISEFPVGNLDTITIIKELIKLINLGSFHLDETIPADWYAEILIKMLSGLPDYYKKDDFKSLFMKLEKELNDSIKKMNISIFSEELEKLKNIRKKKLVLNFVKESLMKIEIPQRIIKFIEKPICYLKIEYSFKQKKFEISDLQKEDYIKEKNKSNNLNCASTREFIDKFPNLTEFELLTGNDLFQYEHDIKMDEYLQKYFNNLKYILFEKSSNLKEKTKEYKESFYMMLKNHILSSIYQKIFPDISNSDDIELYKICFKHSWVKPEHTICRNKKYLLYDNFFSDANECLNQFVKEKTPDKKRGKIEKIDIIIHNIINFNTGKSGEVIERDEIVPFYYYIIIHSQLDLLYSNFRFLTLFFNQDDLILTTFGAALNGIKNLSYNYFSRLMTEDEYYKLCKGQS